MYASRRVDVEWVVNVQAGRMYKVVETSRIRGSV